MDWQQHDHDKIRSQHWKLPAVVGKHRDSQPWCPLCRRNPTALQACHQRVSRFIYSWFVLQSSHSGRMTLTLQDASSLEGEDSSNSEFVHTLTSLVPPSFQASVQHLAFRDLLQHALPSSTEPRSCWVHSSKRKKKKREIREQVHGFNQEKNLPLILFLQQLKLFRNY